MTENRDDRENSEADLEFVEPQAPERAGRSRMWWMAAGGVVLALVVVVIVLVARSGDGDDLADPAGGDGPETVSGPDDDDADTTPAPQTDETDGSTGAEPGPADGGGDDVTGIAGFGDEAGLSIARGGGGDWLVPWGDGYLSFGFVYSGQPMPAFDGSFQEFFPQEVVDLVLSSGVTTIEEATDLLVDAGLYETVVEIVMANPDLQEQIFSVPAPPPTFEVHRSADGLEWEPAAGIEFPFVDIHHVLSDGTRLVVAGVVGADYELGDPGTMQVAITTDLTDWEVHVLAGPDTAGLPDVVRAEAWVGSIAIGPDGWLVTSSINFWLDEWTLLSPHLADLDGGWDVRADESGLTVEIYEFRDEVYPEEEIYPEEAEAVDGDDGADGDDDGPASAPVVEPDLIHQCCEVIDTIELTWAEVGIDYATWTQYREGGNETLSTWTAPWGSSPVQTIVGGDRGLGSVIGTDAGFVATGWDRESDGSILLFSADGREWVERPAPVTGARAWVDQVLYVEGGVVLTSGDDLTRTTWRGDSDATNWQVVDLPPSAADRWWGAWSSSSLPGIATVVDLQEYQWYEGTDAGLEGDDVDADLGFEGPYPEPDFWLLATRDGIDWRLEDLDEPAPEQAYPQHTLINNDTILVRLGDSWRRYELG